MFPHTHDSATPATPTGPVPVPVPLTPLQAALANLTQLEEHARIARRLIAAGEPGAAAWLAEAITQTATDVQRQFEAVAQGGAAHAHETELLHRGAARPRLGAAR